MATSVTWDLTSRVKLKAPISWLGILHIYDIWNPVIRIAIYLACVPVRVRVAPLCILKLPSENRSRHSAAKINYADGTFSNVVWVYSAFFKKTKLASQIGWHVYC